MRLALRKGETAKPMIEARAVYASLHPDDSHNALLRAIYWDNKAIGHTTHRIPLDTPFKIAARFVQIYESSRIFEEPVLLFKPVLQAGVQRAAALCWGLGCPQNFFSPSRRRRRREKREKKGFWGHPKPRQGEPCTPGFKTFFKSLG